MSPQNPHPWTTFLAHSLATRLDTESFTAQAQLLSAKYPLSPASISDILLRPSESNGAALDMRGVRYVGALLAQGGREGRQIVTVASVLRALYRYSSFGIEAEGEGGEDGHGAHGEEKKGNKGGDGEEKKIGRRWTHSYARDELLFYRIAKHVSSGGAIRNNQQAVETMLVCIQWMEVITAAANAQQHEMLSLGAHSHTEEINTAAMALGTLLAAVIQNEHIIRALSKGSAPKGTGKQLSKALANFVPLLLQSSPQSAARLELFRTQTMVEIEPVDRREVEANKELDAILDEGMGLGIESVVVADLPTVNSRAGLYVYLNSLVSGLVLGP